MNENEYIDVTNLVKLRSAMQILRCCIMDNSPGEQLYLEACIDLKQLIEDMEPRVARIEKTLSSKIGVR